MQVKIFYKLAILFCFLIFSSIALCHSGSTAFIELKPSDKGVKGEWLISLIDLQAAVNLDANYDNQISFKEFKDKSEEIKIFVGKNLVIYGAENTCNIDWSMPSLVKFNGGVFVKSPLQADCTEAVSVKYLAFFDINSSHRSILKWASGVDEISGEKSFVFTPEKNQIALDSPSKNVSLGENVFNYLKMGVIHILEGLDHLFFLVALLVPAIFSVFKANQRSSFRGELKQLSVSLLKIVTAFTLGHSVTLVLASVFGFSPPGVLVETIIAFSVVLAGANILFKMFAESSWKVAAMFGLIHGFGFAGALVELGLSKSYLVASLLSFNMGVELGQLLVVLLVTPVLVLLAQRRLSSQVTQLSAGIVIAVFGLLWLVERVPKEGILQLFA